MLISSLAALLLAQAPSTGVNSQSATAQPTVVAATKSIEVGDWTTQCNGSGKAQICDAVQVMIDPTTKVERVRVGFARQKTSGLYGVQARTPLGFRLDTGAMLRFNGIANSGISGIVFNRCITEGCFAEKPLTAQEVASLGAAKQIDLIFLDLAGKPVTVPLSVKGLQEALRKL